MRIILPCLVAAMAMATAVRPAAQTAATGAADLAARLQERYESIRDFTADFTQTYRGLLRRQSAAERGKMLLKKPSRIRFTYDEPDKKVFVSDGVLFKSYFQSQRAGSEHPLPKENETSTALLFLAGRGNLSRDFTASISAGAPAGEYHLGLAPKATQADFETLTLFLDRTTLAVLGFVTSDDQGTNTIRFFNLRENTGLANSAFAFAFPKGTDISR